MSNYLRGSFRGSHLPDGSYQVPHSFGTGFNALASQVLLLGSDVLLSFNAQYLSIPRVLSILPRSRSQSTSFQNREILLPHLDRFEADTV